MSQEFESDFDEIGCTRSGKKYKVDFRYSFIEDSLDSTREQSQSNTKRTVGGIPYHPYTPQKETRTQNNPAGSPSLVKLCSKRHKTVSKLWTNMSQDSGRYLQGLHRKPRRRYRKRSQLLVARG